MGGSDGFTSCVGEALGSHVEALTWSLGAWACCLVHGLFHAPEGHLDSYSEGSYGLISGCGGNQASSPAVTGSSQFQQGSQPLAYAEAWNSTFQSNWKRVLGLLVELTRGTLAFCRGATGESDFHAVRDPWGPWKSFRA